MLRVFEPDVEPLVLVGSSAVARALRAAICGAAGSDATVLISGESGTGKGLAAMLIHRASARRNRPFFALDCSYHESSQHEVELFGFRNPVESGGRFFVGCVESANGGTLLVGEIGTLEPGAQDRMLQLMKDGSFERLGARPKYYDVRHADVRIIATTSRDLARLAEQGALRRDLLERLRAIEIAVPPLRSRLDDIPELARHFLKVYRCPHVVIEPDVLSALQRHDYPDNVSELERIMKGSLSLVRSGTLRIRHMPAKFRG